MKKNSLFILTLIVSFVLLGSCRKTDEPQIPDGTKSTSVVPLITKDAAGDNTISGADPASFNGKINVALYFRNSDQPQKFDIVVIKNGNKGLVKTIQADVTTFPSMITVTGAQLQSLFGEPIIAGDNFDIGANITLQNGELYEAFPAIGEPYGTNVGNEPGASLSVNYAVLCQFDASSFAGNFEVVQDDAEFFTPGDVVPVTMVDDSHISFSFPIVDPQPMVVTIDATNVATVDKQVIGNLDDGEGDLSAQSTPGNDNFVAPCDGVISLNIEYTVAAGSYGSYLLKLRKKD